MRPKRGPRVRESARGGEAGGREAQYDLLTAALIGAAIGATATLLLRRGPSGQRPVAPILEGAKWAGRGAVVAGTRGARWARSRGGDLLDRIPTEEIEENLRETVSDAKERVDEFVRSELDDLRRSLRRHRKRLGV